MAFVNEIIAPSAQHAANFITAMHDNDEVDVSFFKSSTSSLLNQAYGKETRCRPPFFSAFMGHAIFPPSPQLDPK